MTARVEAERAIADVLAEHDLPNPESGTSSCWCGFGYKARIGDTLSNDDHRAHVASVLADLMAERQAEAWDGGFNDGAHYASADLSHATYRTPPPTNPYRPDPKDTRDEQHT